MLLLLHWCSAAAATFSVRTWGGVRTTGTYMPLKYAVCLRNESPSHDHVALPDFLEGEYG